MAFKSPHRMIQARRRMYDDGVLGNLARIFKFDPALVTFTPGMAKRLSAGPFETAPIVQGKFDGSGVPDTIIFGRGDQISRNFYANIDGYQGSLNLWWMPEKDRDATQADDEYIWYDLAGKYHLVYEHDNARFSLRAGEGGDIGYVSHTAVAGTMVHLVFRWDTKNTLDSTNYFSLSINNVHTFVVSTLPTQATPGSSLYVGSEGFFFPANAIIEGETAYRRPLFDGTYGVAANWDDSGPIDEIEEIYAAGAGQDPCLVTGSWDIVFCLPTDSTAGALVTGIGEAWSHPHLSGVLKHQWLEDGGYLGRPWAVLFNGTSTVATVTDGVQIQDLHDAEMSVEAWFRSDDDSLQVLVGKGNPNLGADGWSLQLRADGAVNFRVFCATTLTAVTSSDSYNDGKWHHVIAYFNDAGGADRKAYIAIDGKWEPAGTLAVGAIETDVGIDLRFGRLPGASWYLDGAISWSRISDNDRYTHGTDFIPLRQAPANDGNTIVMYHFDEGTGVTLDNEQGAAAYDGTIANGTWEEQWDIETTPIVPYSIEFDGDATSVNLGSAAIIDNLADDIITAEAWVRCDGSDGTSRATILSKTASGTGWELRLNGQPVGGGIAGIVWCDTTSASSRAFINSNAYNDGKWHHIVMYFNDAGDRKIYLALDGLWATSYDTQTAGVGAIVADAGNDLQMGSRPDLSGSLDGNIGYARISDNDRYTVATEDPFTPPSRLNPPGVDGNTIAQWNFRDGPGTVLLDETANNNDGTITPGDGGWRITPDMEIDSPGERIFNWGYVIGNDAVDEGIKETLSGLAAGENYVVRAVAHVESASRGRPKIIIYDETNGAEITALEGPSFTGAHDGGAGVADLADSTARWPQMLVGWTLYNITDRSSTTVTGIDGDMQGAVGALAGGVTNLWNISDEYRFVPPGGPSEYDDFPWIETFTFELPTIARNGVAADCVSISLKLVNGVNNGVIKWHQVELLENLIDNPSLETGAGNPWIPDGWINNGLDPGDSVQELATVHSGSGAIEFAVGASSEGIDILNVYTTGNYFNYGVWFYGNGADEIRIGRQTVNIEGHAGSPNFLDVSALNWIHTPFVYRRDGNDGPRTLPLAGAITARYADDSYAFVLDDVSLTITPASEANSEENGGLRVDGLDFMPQPIPAGDLTATSGWIKWKYTPRHDAADVLMFGIALPRIARFRFDATHYIELYWQGASQMRLAFNDGGGLHFADWNPATQNAGTEYVMEIKYNAGEMILKVDGVIQITITTPIDFGVGILNNAYWGTIHIATTQIDAVFSAP